jgi:hypothetical protein
MRVGHTIADLLRQRFNGLALGHKELIGHYVLRHDPWLTAVLDKRGDALADNIMPNRLEHVSKIGINRHHKFDSEPAKLPAARLRTGAYAPPKSARKQQRMIYAFG